jgi:hypothetical protein
MTAYSAQLERPAIPHRLNELAIYHRLKADEPPGTKQCFAQF